MGDEKMKTRVLSIIVVIALVGAVIALWHFQVLQGLFAGHSGTGPIALSEEGQAEEREGEKIVQLNEAALKESAIEIAAAGPGKLQIHDTLSGEIAFNSDKLAHIVPRVPGVVREVYQNLGDTVRAGTVLAVLESRDLADAKAAYLAAIARLGLAQANFTREESLRQEKITAEKDYLESKQALAEAQIALRSAEQKLHALGLSEEDLKALPSHAETSYTRCEITAPIDGTIVEKHIVLGEVFKEDSNPCFVIADLTSVWVDLKVHQQDLSHIRPGLAAVIKGGDDLQTEGTIAFVSNVVSEASHMAFARLTIPNPEGRWRPGLFVTGLVVIDEATAGVAVPKEALVRLDGRTCVFLQTDRGFVPQAVTVGRSNDRAVEITAGLQAGQKYVTRGAYTLKSELNKPSVEE
jgi:cobalt-zinc-cadmium efflux system membrane fusion protein